MIYRSTSAGELSAQNKLKLDKVFVCLSDITQKAQLLERDVSTSLQEHTEELETLQGDYTPIAMSRALQGGLKECGGELIRLDLIWFDLNKRVKHNSYKNCSRSFTHNIFYI